MKNVLSRSENIFRWGGGVGARLVAVFSLRYNNNTAVRDTIHTRIVNDLMYIEQCLVGNISKKMYHWWVREPKRKKNAQASLKRDCNGGIFGDIWGVILRMVLGLSVLENFLLDFFEFFALGCKIFIWKYFATHHSDEWPPSSHIAALSSNAKTDISISMGEHNLISICINIETVDIGFM